MPRMGRAVLLHSHREGVSCTSPKSPNQDKLGIDGNVKDSKLLG
jgi:hypothetical protein